MLGDQIQPMQAYLRAANLESHQELGAHYIPTGRALEVLRRLVRSIDDPTSGRAWSLTGPYGAGKSSFALFLRSLLGPETAMRAAENSLRSADESLSWGLSRARAKLGAEAEGFILATTTCQREPISDSLLRALTHGCSVRWPSRRPPTVVAALNSARATRAARDIAAAAGVIAKFGPVLIVLDEFGKTLEHFASQASDRPDAAADLFVLQELAEQSMGDSASPIFTFTLQHLAFDDYVRQASANQRREWGKIQGRFEDVSFLESAEQSLRLIAGALDDSQIDPGFARERRGWAGRSFSTARDVGLANLLPGGTDTLEHCYPLHPVALLALPELCARLGQHGRTLFTFLASSETGTVRTFLDETEVPLHGMLPAIQLTGLFDFFAGAGSAIAAGVGGSRWREIHERVQEAASLAPEDLAVLKTVGLLNLAGSALGVRASADIVTFALSQPDARPDPSWRARLEDLEGRGFLTYRSFADEYRLWQGSDVDLRGRVADAREQLRSTNAADLLARLQSDAPLIAARHSQEVGMLRYFTVAYSDDGARTVPALSISDPADGVVVYHLGSPESAVRLESSADPRPTVLVTSERASRVRDAAIEVAAALAVLDQQEVVDDRVARRELQDRATDARSRLSQVLADAFRPGSDGVQFEQLAPDGTRTRLSGSRGISRMLSDVCDQAYAFSPHIKNEMLGRRDLTSQGAKARRELIQAMIEHPSEERLGIQGFGPERAMYDAILRHTGLHSDRGGEWGFGRPDADSTLQHAWGYITQFINSAVDEAATVDRLYVSLKAPRIGLKEGPIPVLLVAHLLQRSDDVAIYEEGTFQPSLTADMVERLVKAPQRFALKSFSIAGGRSRILAAVGRATLQLGGVGVRPMSASRLRNETVLAVATPLLRFVRGLPKSTLQTKQLSEQALAVREALLKAREPDRLMLIDLPKACGFAGSAWRNPSPATLTAFTEALRSALVELSETYDRQLAEIGALLGQEFGRRPGAATAELREHLRHRAEPLEGKVLETRLRTFIFNAGDSSSDDLTWLGIMGLALSDKSVELWQDDDRQRFRSVLHELSTSFRRVEALHFDVAARSIGSTFVARRISSTTPDGREEGGVVYYTSDMAAILGDLVDETLATAEARIGGAHGREALAALLLDRLYLTREASVIRLNCAANVSAEDGEVKNGN